MSAQTSKEDAYRIKGIRLAAAELESPVELADRLVTLGYPTEDAIEVMKAYKADGKVSFLRATNDIHACQFGE